MCGITGFFGVGTREDIERMTEALRHRGPDDGHVFMAGKLALGHRRLSIIDLENGVQPMRDPETGAVIVYNGEIYNHLSIRMELAKLGHVFRTAHSDTETLLHAFEEWGIDCLVRLNGMFALAIYEPNQKKIWLARDRFGEKPLFYSKNEKGFAFASELCGLRLWPGFANDLDEANIQRFFAWNYLPNARTMYKNCFALPPGSWLCLDMESGETVSGRYWQFRLSPDKSLERADDRELAEELRRLLIQAVRRRFLSDVPLGIFLSGGIDSSAILCAAGHIADRPSIRSFTIGFREKSFDESDKAAQVAAFAKTRNEVEYLTEQEIQDSISGILSLMSEPFGDPSLIPTAHLARFARRHVKVALSGDGGDELFGGYDPLDAIRPSEIYRKFMPAKLHAHVRRLVNLLPASDRNMSLDFKLKRWLRGLGYPPEIQLPVWMSGLEPAEIKQFFSNPLDAETLYADAIALCERSPGLSGLEQALNFFTRLYLPDDILVKSDRASMMFSLETRAVFLDNDIVEFCEKLPQKFKYRNGQRKYILKKALEGWLPRHILEQPKKGFGIPLNRWLRTLRNVQPPVPGLVPGSIAMCWKRHQKRAGDYRFFLWDLQSYNALPA